MSVTIQDNFSTAAAKPTDARYGPYANLAAAKSAIPDVYRYIGLTVGIGTPIQEYWWDNGITDGDLVQKTTVGNVTGVSAGTGILVNNTNPQIPAVSVDTSYVQTVSNLSLDVSTDGTSNTKYPSVKAVKDYADGLVVGLLNDRGSWPGGSLPFGAYPSTGGSGPAGAILKGDIWFINTSGYLGTTAVAIGASVRALVDSPSPVTASDWDIIDAGLGFTPENIGNKVTAVGDPTSVVQYPSVKAMVDYIAANPPTVTIPTLQQVTSVPSGNITTTDVYVKSLYVKDGATTDNWNILSNAGFQIVDKLGLQRISFTNTGGTVDFNVDNSNIGTLNFVGISGNQVYTFPNATGTVALTSNISSSLVGYVPYTGATTDVDLGHNNSVFCKQLNLWDNNNLGYVNFSVDGDILSYKGTTGSEFFRFVNDSLETGYVNASNYVKGSSLISETSGYNGTIKSTNLTANRNYELPNNSGTLTIGNGTPNTLTKFSSTDGVLIDSQIFDNGTNVGIGTVSPSSKLYVDGDITISSPNKLNLSYVTLGGSTTTSALDYATFRSTGTNKGIAVVAKANGTPSLYGYAFQFIADGADINQLLLVGDNYTQKHVISTSTGTGGTSWPLVLRCPTGLWNASANDLLTLTKDQSVKINDGGASSPSEPAVLELISTDKGFLPPRMTASQRTGISNPTEGLMVYQTDSTNGIYVYDGTIWRRLNWT